MASGGPFQSLYRARLARARRRRFAENLASLLAGLGFAVVAVVATRWAWGESALFGWAAGGWAIAAAVSVLVAFVLSRPGGRARRLVAEALERERGAGGALLAASWMAEGGDAGRLAPLVQRDADAAAVAARAARDDRGTSPLPTTWLVVALGLVALSLLLPTVPSPARIGASGPLAVSRTEPPANGGRSVGPGGEGGGAARGTAKRPDASELARFEIRTDRKIYLLGEDIRLTAVLRPKAGVGRDVPLEVMIGVTDGLPSPDVGFGIGVRPIAPGWSWTVPEDPSTPPQSDTLVLNGDLRRFGIYKVGLLTIQAWAVPSDETHVEGGLVANTLTIQIAENRLKQRIRKPNPVDFAKNPRKKKSDPKKDKQGRGKRGDKKPRPGPKDRLERAQRKAKAVKPLLTDGPRVEKEVEVFDRQRGGQAPRPRPRPPATETPARTFIKQEEEAIRRVPLTPRDRRVLKRYFDAVRRRGR